MFELLFHEWEQGYCVHYIFLYFKEMEKRFTDYNCTITEVKTDIPAQWIEANQVRLMQKHARGHQ